MITYRPEVSLRLQQIAGSVERIGAIMPERAQSACEEAAAILHECASEFAPAPPKPPDRARQHAAKVAAQAKLTGVGRE